MTNTRMLELSILYHIITEDFVEGNVYSIGGRFYDCGKILEKFHERLAEFLEPYRLESDLNLQLINTREGSTHFAILFNLLKLNRE